MLVRSTISRNAAGLCALTVLGIICCGAAVRSPAITTNAKNHSIEAPCRVKSSIAYSYGCENYHCENHQTMCEGGSTYMLWSTDRETTDHTDDITLTLLGADGNTAYSKHGPLGPGHSSVEFTFAAEIRAPTIEQGNSQSPSTYQLRFTPACANTTGRAARTLPPAGAGFGSCDLCFGPDPAPAVAPAIRDDSEPIISEIDNATTSLAAAAQGSCRCVRPQRDRDTFSRSERLQTIFLRR